MPRGHSSDRRLVYPCPLERYPPFRVLSGTIALTARWRKSCHGSTRESAATAGRMDEKRQVTDPACVGHTTWTPARVKAQRFSATIRSIRIRSTGEPRVEPPRRVSLFYCLLLAATCEPRTRMRQHFCRTTLCLPTRSALRGETVRHDRASRRRALRRERSFAKCDSALAANVARSGPRRRRWFPRAFPDHARVRQLSLFCTRTLSRGDELRRFRPSLSPATTISAATDLATSRRARKGEKSGSVRIQRIYPL